MFCKNRPNRNKSFSNFRFLTSNYQNYPRSKFLLILIIRDPPTGRVKVQERPKYEYAYITIFRIFFFTNMIKERHVVYHWVALELGYPKIELIARYISSPEPIWQKCHFLNKTVFLDFNKIKKQPNLNFYIFRKTIRWCIRIKNKIRVFCFARFLRS